MRSAVNSLAILAATIALVSPTILSAQGETPLPILATVPFPGSSIGDICFDQLANLVYVVDSANNDTHVYSSTLMYLGVNPGPFPANTQVVGVTSEPTVGAVIWVVRDLATNVESVFAAVNIASAPFFVSNIAGSPGSANLGVDAPAGLGNVLVLNDVGNVATTASDYFGVQILGPVANPGGVSLGISHLTGSFIAHTTFQLTGALSVVLMDVFTGLAVDTVGVLTSPIGTQSPGFDFGPLTPVGANTIYTGDILTNTISLSTFQRTFLRGDANSDSLMNIADVLFLLGTLFGGGPASTCVDAADANDDGTINIGDPLSVLNTLFLGTGPLPPPFGFCGFDPTPDANRCAVSAPICP
ncbi:MAG: hypothetical protein ACKVX7_08705 [Planctomycetota bacterium]